MLYIVATPIGNLQDMTHRAVETLKSVDLIACEDTRHTGILLAAYQIRTPRVSYHSYSNRSKETHLLDQLQEGKHVALVSDAGMPGISDPGSALIRGALERGVEVTVIPGASASLAALALSGFAMDRFIFEGFLPLKPGPRRKRLEALLDEERSVIFYESPHRMLKLLEEIEAVFGDVPVSVSRELTKKFEETRRGPVAGIRAHFTAHPPKGEFVVVLPPKREREGQRTET